VNTQTLTIDVITMDNVQVLFVIFSGKIPESNVQDGKHAFLSKCKQAFDDGI